MLKSPAPPVCFLRDTSLSFGEHAAESALYLIAILGRVIPVDGALQSIFEKHLRLPPEQFLREGVVSNAIERACRHVGPQLDLGFMPREIADHSHRVDDLYPLHRSQVNGRAVVDFFASENRAFNNILDVCPIADLRSVAPYFEGVLPKESPRNHRDYGMVLHPPRSVHREVAARGCAHAVFFRISTQRKLAHQLGPAVSVVGVVRSFCKIFREVELFLHVRLQKIRIDAARGCEHHLFHFRTQSFRENKSVQEKIGSRSRLMQIDIAAAAMICSQMKYRIHALHGRAGNARLAQVCVDEFDFTAGGVFLDIVTMPAGQIINDANFRATREKVICKGRANKRGASRHKYEFLTPKCFRSRHAFTAPSMIFTNFCNSLTLS